MMYNVRNVVYTQYDKLKYTSAWTSNDPSKIFLPSLTLVNQIHALENTGNGINILMDSIFFIANKEGDMKFFKDI